MAARDTERPQSEQLATSRCYQTAPYVFGGTAWASGSVTFAKLLDEYNALRLEQEFAKTHICRRNKDSPWRAPMPLANRTI